MCVTPNLWAIAIDKCNTWTVTFFGIANDLCNTQYVDTFGTLQVDSNTIWVSTALATFACKRKPLTVYFLRSLHN